MKYQILPNGKVITFRFLSLNFRLSKTLKLYRDDSGKFFLIQFNKFENGNCNLYIRLFLKYSLGISGLKINNEKRIFVGNTEEKSFYYINRY